MWLWVMFSLWSVTLARSSSLFDLVLDSVKCSCARTADMDVSLTKIHVYKYQSGSLGSWYLMRDAVNNIMSRDWVPGQCVAIYVTGYMNQIDGSPVKMTRCAMSRARCPATPYRPLLLIIDHSHYTAPATITDRLRLVAFYQESVTYAKSIGYSVGKFLVELTKWVDRNNVYLIGHSLGAHIAGYAAEYVKSATGSRLSTLYGIDPAAPCFQKCPGEHIRSGLADTVLTIHCNAGEQGSSLNIADFDFYSGDGHSQAVCSPPGYDLFYAQYSSSCSHNACVSIALSSSFLESGWSGTKCPDFSSYQGGSCPENETTSEIGVMRVPATSPGVYYFTSPADLQCYVT